MSLATTESQPNETQYQPPRPDEDPEEFTVITLLAEDPLAKRYLVEWMDIDPETGWKYRPSWEPKTSCTNDLIEDWKDKVAKGEVKRGKKYGTDLLKQWDAEAKRTIKQMKGTPMGKARADEALGSGSKSKGKKKDASTRGSTVEPVPVPTSKGHDGARRSHAEVEDDGLEVLIGGDENDEDDPELDVGAGRRSKGKGTDNSIHVDSPVGKKRKRAAKENEDDESYRVGNSGNKKVQARSGTGREVSEAVSEVPSAASSSKGRPTRPVRGTAKAAAGPAAGGPIIQTSSMPIAARVRDRSRSQSVTMAITADVQNKQAKPPSKLIPAHKAKQTAGSTANAEAGPFKAAVTAAPTNQVAHSADVIDDDDLASPVSSPVARKGAKNPIVIDMSVSVASRAKPAAGPSAAAAEEASPETPKNAPEKGASATTTAALAAPPRKLAPMPQPSAQQSRQAQQKQVELTQSTGTATQDTIGQFSSPLRGDEMRGPTKTAERGGRPGKGSTDNMVVEEAPTSPAEQAGGEVGDSLPPGVEKRIIDGEEVIVAIDGSETSQEPSPNHQAQVEVDADADLDMLDVDLPAPIELSPAQMNVDQEVVQQPAEAQRPVMMDQAVQVDVAATVAAGTMTAETPIKEVQDKAVVTDTMVVEVIEQTTTTEVRSVPAVDAVPSGVNEEEQQQLAEIQAQLAAMQAEVAEVRARNASLEQDYNFIKAQYDIASSRAVEEVNLNRDLSKKLKVKESQLTIGLKQKDMHVAAVRQRDRDAIKALEVQNKILLDQARRTDDSIRHKAVMFPRTKKENENLVQENAHLQKRLENLQKRNEMLVEQVEVFRAREMGVLDKEDSEGDAEDDMTDTDSEDDEGGGQDMAALGYSTRPANMTSSGHIFESLTTTMYQSDRQRHGSASGGVDSISVKLEEMGQVVDGPGMAFECTWRTEEADQQCGALLESREAFEQHWAAAHQPVAA